MDGKILVTYASKYGATREIAEKIGEVLRRLDLAVDILPVSQIGALAPYQAVVLGSAVYIGKWQKEAAAFLQANEQALAQRPVWLFSSGPTGEGDPLALLEGQRLPKALQPVIDRICPQDVVVFHGFIDLEKLTFMEKWAITRVVKKPVGDFRDWRMVEAWAGRIAAACKAYEPVR